MKRTLHIAVFCMLAAGITSCSASKKMTKDSIVVAEQPTSVWQSGEMVSAKSNTSLTYKSKNINLGGTLRMKRDDVIQLNLSYTMIFTIQVGTLQLTKDSVLLLNRIGNQYASGTYEELSQLIGHNITFADVQKYFWGEASDVDLTNLSLKYNGFTTLTDGRRLPQQVNFRLQSQGKSVDATLALSDEKLDTSWKTRIEIDGGKYTRLTMQQVMVMIMFNKY